MSKEPTDAAGSRRTATVNGSNEKKERIAVLLPCLNEAGAIGQVVEDFRAALPEADIYVFDNGSSDTTVLEAASAGAIVRQEPRKGKGQVVRRMFADVDADVYVMADGDNTYDAALAPMMIEMLLDGQLDLVTCARVPVEGGAAFRQGHQFGNRMLTGLVAAIFGQQMTDMLSGYKVLSRRFVKSFPALSTGFEIETEITVHALELRMPVAECTASYRERTGGTTSKLKTYSDGFRILGTIISLLKEERPLQFFGVIAALLAALAMGLAAPLLAT